MKIINCRLFVVVLAVKERKKLLEMKAGRVHLHKNRKAKTNLVGSIMPTGERGVSKFPYSAPTVDPKQANVGGGEGQGQDFTG